MTEALARAGELGLRTVRRAAEELEQRRPFGVVIDALGIRCDASDRGRAAIAELLGCPPGNRRLASLAEIAETEFLIIEAILHLVEGLCASGPVAIAVEDVQWCDPSTLLLLHRLARTIQERPIMLIATCRPLPRTPDLDRFLYALRSRGALDLALGPLDGASIHALVEARLGADPGPALSGRVAAAGGNPFFVLELIEALERAGAIRITPQGKAETSAAPLPPSLTRSLSDRLNFLSRQTLEVLRVAAILGSRFSAGDLAAVMGKTPVELMKPLSESMAAGALSEDGPFLAFRHDLVRESLYETIPQPLRTSLHLATGRALAAEGRPAPQVAEHLMRGASPGDAEAVRWLGRAGYDVASRAPAVAAGLLERALELCEPSDPSRDRLLAELAVCLAWSGRMPRAEEICRGVLAREHDPSVEATLYLSLVQTLLSRGRMDEAASWAGEALESAALSEAERTRFLAWASNCRLATGDLEGARQLAERAKAAGESVRDDLTRCISMGVLAAVNHFRGRFQEGLELVETAIRLADRSPGGSAHRFPLNIFRGLLLLDLDRPEEAREAIRQGVQLGEKLGAGGVLPAYQWVSAMERFFSGHLDDAVAHCEAALEAARETGMRQGMLFAYSIRAVIAVRRNDLEGAREMTMSGAREFRQNASSFGLHWQMWAQALLSEAEGRPEDGLAVLSNAWDLCTGARLVSEYPLIGPDLVRMSLGAGELARAEAVVATLERLAAAHPGVSPVTGAALRGRGLLEADLETLLRGVETLRGGTRPFELAAGCEDAGEALARAGRRIEARERFEEAFDVYQRLGTDRETFRLHARLRALGLRRGPRGPRRRPRYGWESLTETELEVVRMVAEGASNPEVAERLFISRPTVKTHVSHALSKLGLTSRVQLAAAAARRIG